MRRLTTLALILILVAACASPPPLSRDFATAADRAYAEGKTTLSGWYWYCNFWDQGYACPGYSGPVETTKEAALRGKEDYVRRNPEYRDFVSIFSTDVDLPLTNERRPASATQSSQGEPPRGL